MFAASVASFLCTEWISYVVRLAALTPACLFLANPAADINATAQPAALDSSLLKELNHLKM